MNPDFVGIGSEERQRFIDWWFTTSPSIIAALDECCGYNVDDRKIVSQFLELLMKRPFIQDPDRINALTRDDFEKIIFPHLAAEFNALRDPFQQLEVTTPPPTPPTLWGDFLRATGSAIDPSSSLLLREPIFKHLNLENVYCHSRGKIVLLLECECMDWSMCLLELGMRVDPHYEKQFESYLDMKPQFGVLNPKDFVPSVLHYAELERQKRDKRIYPGGLLRNYWYWPLMTLPMLFSCSPNPHDFDKKQLLTTIKKWLEEDSFQPIPIRYKKAFGITVATLGLHLTWHPSIHSFASIQDQRKIELFYLSSRGDQNCSLFGLPIDIFRRIFEQNYTLGQTHKRCPQCTDDPPKRPWQVGVSLCFEDQKSCCTCQCFRVDAKISFSGWINKQYPGTQIFEYCLGEDPLVESWGESWGLYQTAMNDIFNDIEEW